MHTRRLGKMLRGILGFCNPNLLLCEDHLDSGKKILWYIMTACVIMHNMIIKNARRQGLDYTFYHLMRIRLMPMRREERIKRFMKVYNEIRDSDAPNQLQKDLLEEYWKYHGERGTWFHLFVCCIVQKLCCMYAAFDLVDLMNYVIIWYCGQVKILSFNSGCFYFKLCSCIVVVDSRAGGR